MKLTIANEKSTVEINSEEIIETLKLYKDISSSRDISASISQDGVAAYDCVLSNEIFHLIDLEELEEELGEDIEESDLEVLFEDIRAYIKEFIDDVEVDLQDKYKMDSIRCNFDIYSIGDDFTNFKFVLLVSFKEMKLASLNNLAKIVSKRQLGGNSKYYN